MNVEAATSGVSYNSPLSQLSNLPKYAWCGCTDDKKKALWMTRKMERSEYFIQFEMKIANTRYI